MKGLRKAPAQSILSKKLAHLGGKNQKKRGVRARRTAHVKKRGKINEQADLEKKALNARLRGG